MYVNKPKGPTYYSDIKNVTFYVLGSEENKFNSDVLVTNELVMKGDYPMKNGIYDSRMGTTSNKWNCLTCYNAKTLCPGHFGSIELKYPVKSPMFRDELLKWLKITCYYCGQILPNINSSKTLSEAIKLVKDIDTCPRCGETHLQVIKSKENPIVFYRTSSDEKTSYKEFYNHEIREVVQKIDGNSKEYINLNKPLMSHPSKFILDVISVPPNTIRPDIRRMGGARSSNSDTTSLLKTIVEINKELPDKIPDHSHMSEGIRNSYTLLDMTYYAMVKGDGGGETKMITNTNKAPVAIAQRIPGKPGRIRSNLMGKRVNNMIRSVITGDSRLKIDEVGVPLIHAKNLEIPETVTEKNRDRLMIYFTNKTNRYPGCKHIVKKSNPDSIFRTDRLPADYELQVGDIIYRDMITGDYIAFNRQPTLLFSNISGMRVVVMETGDTLRINPSICLYFNADFDGDQMNGIILQNIESINECMTISNVSRWLISPQSQAPLVGAFQDGLIGISELSKDNLLFDKWHAMNMLSDINLESINSEFNEKHYTNRDLISKLLPKINLIKKTPSIYKSSYAHCLKYNPNDIVVNIENGKLISGVLDKSTSGQNVMGSIFHIIANQYGNSKALETVYNLQQIVHKFFLYHGFTVGVKDINISSDAMKIVKSRVAKMIESSYAITHRLNTGKLIAPIGTSLLDYYEEEQLNALSTGDDFVEPILNDVDFNTNGMLKLIMTGSKGKIPNFIAINGVIGVNTINGKRFGYQAGWGRTSPYFTRYDTDPAAKGFVSMSFREGISNEVYSFVAGEARHGLISNALSTSVTGSQNRISTKNLESIIVDNLRKASKNSNVVQILYAETGLDPGKTENVKFPTVMISDKDFTEKYLTDIKKLDKKFQNKTVKELLEKEFQQISNDRDEFRNTFMKLEDHNPKVYVMKDSKQVPVNIQHIIEDTYYSYSEVLNKKILNPNTVIEKVNKLCNEICYVFMNDNYRINKMPIPAYIINSSKLMLILIRCCLSVSNLLRNNINDQMLDIIIDRIIITYKKALIDYGTSVGVLAAQCISEPMTQYVLDSKHRTGGQGGTKTNAIEKIKEIFGVRGTDSMKNPYMLIMVKPEYENDKSKVQEIANHIEMMTFNRFILNTKVFYEEFGKPVHKDFIHEQKEIIEIMKHNYGKTVPGDLAKWCIRYEINKEELMLKSLKLETIITAIKSNHKELFIIHTPENSNTVYIRCYFRTSMVKHSNEFYRNIIVPTMDNIGNVIVRGIKDIISTAVTKIIKHIKNPDGSLSMGNIYGIYTVGSNMSEILSNPYIDPYRTQSDSIEETERIFGIVATRNKIINEMMIALDGLNRVHCTIFADEMTFAGYATSIQKTGLQQRENSNITLRMSFQTPIQVVQDAAINGLTDTISGISGPLMMGSSIKTGTAYNQIIINTSTLLENKPDLNKVLDEL